ncbi:MAG: hypothetical protein J6X86_00645 [Bacteroidales bacterium]|nr:hypothetical protein [Bacteroidales bacterium]
MTSKTDIRKTPVKQPRKAAGNSVFRLPGSTGKELDLETGYSYFGARYLDNALSTAWLSVDPMADKYPSISPYAYCSWNPVKLVDPDGQDVWSVSEDGTIQKTSNDGGTMKQTVKYSNGTVAIFRGNKYYKTISDLSIITNNNVSSSYGDENMQTAYAKVFKFMADNTNVEWGIERYTDNTYSIGTKHDTEHTPSTYYLSKGHHDNNDVVTLIHSHPMNGVIDPTSNDSQMESMGYWYNRGEFRGDACNKRLVFRNTNYYTYFPHTNQLWSIGFHRPAYIRRIRIFSDLFFGTYNSK